MDLIESGQLEVATGPVFGFDQLVEAHRLMTATKPVERSSF